MPAQEALIASAILRTPSGATTTLQCVALESPVLNENDKMVAMAILMVAGYAQGPVPKNYGEKVSNSQAHDALPTTGKMRHAERPKMNTLKHR